MVGKVKKIVCSVFFLVGFYQKAGSSLVGDFQAQLIKGPDIYAEKDFFKSCLASQYQHCLQETKSFALNLLSKDESLFEEDDDKMLFFHMFFQNELIGYASFVIESENTVFLRNFALSSDYCIPLVVQELLFAPFELVDGVSRLHGMIIKGNTELESVFKKIGFCPLLQAEQDCPVGYEKYELLEKNDLAGQESCLEAFYWNLEEDEDSLDFLDTKLDLISKEDERKEGLDSRNRE